MDQSPNTEVKPARISPWTPLAVSAYRNFWLAGLFSNIGTWMHETGAVWLMTDLEPRPEMVTAVRFAMTLPVFMLVLAAGVWADHFDRRRWLLGTQSLLLVIALLMWICTAAGWMTPWLLLLLTFCLGTASTLNLPAWQALTPELVPATMIPSAIQAGSVSFNLARSIGPAIAGILIAQFSVGITFLLNAVSFLGTIAVLASWKSNLPTEPARKKNVRFMDELKKGLFIVKTSMNVRNTLIRVLLFSFAASSLWSLLSLVATEQLEMREKGFGLCLATLGCGAVLAAGILPWARQRFSSEWLVLFSQFALGSMLLLLAFSSLRYVSLVGLLIFGAFWMTGMTTFHATAQVYLPRKFRARGMSANVMLFSLGMGVGSMMWGQIAKYSSVGTSLGLSGMVMVFIAIFTHRLTLGPLARSEGAMETEA